MLAELQADRARVAELQTRILALERTLSELRLEQSKLHGRLDAYKYPVLALPNKINEIVSEIFMHFLPSYPAFPQLIGAFSPTLLTQICRRWRNIAASTPQLWSAISFDDEGERDGDIFELWLKRSRHCPLSIGDSSSPRPLGVPKIDINPPDIPDIFDGPMPLLRRLDLGVEHILFPTAAGPVDFTRYDMLLLHTLVLGGHAALRTIFPWTQLTSLTFPIAHPSKCVPILAQTRNLVHCELRVGGFRPGNRGPQQDIRLPCLEFLTFNHRFGDPVTDFLLTLRVVVPAFRNLEIPESYLAPDPLGSLMAFVSKSGCRLEELHLTGQIVVPENSYGQAFPSLRISFGDDFLDKIPRIWRPQTSRKIVLGVTQRTSRQPAAYLPEFQTEIYILCPD
ncbi:hypothetical protein DFH06DRAFT_1481780 [Mycena polygramma]|nr:hypothetical protein DFH06DRAFT_1481780 [Mycena polygramma]